MAELVVIGYPTEAGAQEVMCVLRALERDRVIHTACSAVVVRDDDGELRVATPTHAAGAGAASGALWGMVIGLLFFMPAGGVVAGGAMGTLFDQMSDLGINDEFKARVGNLLRPGTAAVTILFQKSTPERTIDALAPYGGTVLRTRLSHAVEQHLQESLTSGRPTALSA